MQGFKEWALICEALGRGEQSLIVRKGGIAEGRAGFRFAHEEFLLFPTLFHEQAAKLKVPAETPLPQARLDGQHLFRHLARVEWTADLTDPELIPALAPFHLWTDATLAERFQYGDKLGLSLAFVRVYQLAEPFLTPDSPKYGGCRSWITLPEPPSLVAAPVLSDEEHARRAAAIRAVLSAQTAASAPSVQP